jgi:hypothetical protein
LVGKKWSKIASFLPGRAYNDVKNRWYTYLNKIEKVSHTKKQCFDFWNELDSTSIWFWKLDNHTPTKENDFLFE